MSNAAGSMPAVSLRLITIGTPWRSSFNRPTGSLSFRKTSSRSQSISHVQKAALPSNGAGRVPF